MGWRGEARLILIRGAPGVRRGREKERSVLAVHSAKKKISFSLCARYLSQRWLGAGELKKVSSILKVL